MQPIRVVPGAQRHLLDASPPGGPAWYINDHTLIRDENGRWHVFGIWHPEPADPLHEDLFLHASAADLTDAPWTVHEPVIRARQHLGETHVWAPHVIGHDGRYWMFYCGGTADHSRYRIELATSEDLFSWDHQPEPLFEDGFDARDPMVVQDGDRWLMYYTRTSTPEGGFHEVAVRTSPDLLHWSPAQVAYRSSVTGTFGGPVESPFVIRVGGVWLLFVCDATAYDRTMVYVSANPMQFGDEGEIGVELDEHCAEIVTDGDRFWITGGGWGRGGLSIRELRLEPVD